MKDLASTHAKYFTFKIIKPVYNHRYIKESSLLLSPQTFPSSLNIETRDVSERGGEVFSEGTGRD